MAGLERWVLLWKLAPLRSRAQHPQHTVQHRPRIMPRTATVVLPPPRPQHRFYHRPLFFGQLPASCHRSRRRSLQSTSSMTANKPSDVYETGSRLLAEAGFAAVWHCVQAAEAGAPHKRDRFFCIAWRNSVSCNSVSVATPVETESLAYSPETRCEGERGDLNCIHDGHCGCAPLGHAAGD